MCQHEVLNVMKEYDGLTTKQVHKILLNKGVNILENTVSTNLSKLCRKKHVFKYYDGKKNQAPKYVHKSKLTPEIQDMIVNIKIYKKRQRRKNGTKQNL